MTVPASAFCISAKLPNRVSAEFLFEPFLQALPEQPALSPRCLPIARIGHMKILVIYLGLRHVFLNLGTTLGVATVQDPGELTLAITERSHDGSARLLSMLTGNN